MSVVYGAYFSTSGGKNFVRPVIDYTVSYTATKVSVTYKAGINVKSGWHTNAKFTSTFSATGQESKTRVDNNKGWEAGNHFIFGSTTITYNKTTSAQTKTLKMYSKSSVDSSSKSVSINIPALGLPTISDATAGRVESTPTSVTVSFKASSSNNSAITAKINGEVVTAVNGIYSKTFANASSDQHNYTITATDSIGTSTRTLTVPKLALPQVDVICTRDETDATKVVFGITANSFYKDNISNISIVVGSTSATVTGGIIGDSNALTVTKELTGLAETALAATVSVTGYGGTAAINVTVPSAFRTLDIGGEGKTLAFGMTARDKNIPENGLFECGMDADFKGAVSLDITKLGIADYIVEQGTSGIWTYKKWNDGIVEAWANASTKQAIATALGNVYRAPNAVTTNFPFTITEPKVYLVSQSGVVNGAYIAELSNTSFNWFPIKYGKDSTSRVRTIAAYVNGKWK